MSISKDSNVSSAPKSKATTFSGAKGTTVSPESCLTVIRLVSATALLLCSLTALSTDFAGAAFSSPQAASTSANADTRTTFLNALDFIFTP